VDLTVQKVQTASSQTFGSSNTAEGLQDQFMQILLTQLKYQDPMAPMEEKDFFAQMAQFTTATQVQDLNDKVSVLCNVIFESEYSKAFLGASNLIGKEFQAAVEDGYVSGSIEGVGFVEGKLVVKSEDRLIPFENLVWIGGTNHGSEDTK